MPNRIEKLRLELLDDTVLTSSDECNLYKDKPIYLFDIVNSLEIPNCSQDLQSQVLLMVDHIDTDYQYCVSNEGYNQEDNEMKDYFNRIGTEVDRTAYWAISFEEDEVKVINGISYKVNPDTNQIEEVSH